MRRVEGVPHPGRVCCDPTWDLAGCGSPANAPRSHGCRGGRKSGARGALQRFVGGLGEPAHRRQGPHRRGRRRRCPLVFGGQRRGRESGDVAGRLRQQRSRATVLAVPVSHSERLGLGFSSAYTKFRTRNLSVSHASGRRGQGPAQPIHGSGVRVRVRVGRTRVAVALPHRNPAGPESVRQQQKSGGAECVRESKIPACPGR